MPTQKSLNQLSAFLNLYQHAKNQFISYVHFWDTVSFKVSWPDWPHPFIPCLPKKKFDQLLISLNLNQYAKNQFFHLFILQIQSILETCHPTFDYPNPKIFNQLLICMNLYQHAKNQLIPFVHSSDTVNFRVQRPDFPNPFLTMPNQNNHKIYY